MEKKKEKRREFFFFSFVLSTFSAFFEQFVLLCVFHLCLSVLLPFIIWYNHKIKILSIYILLYLYLCEMISALYLRILYHLSTKVKG